MLVHFLCSVILFDWLTGKCLNKYHSRTRIKIYYVYFKIQFLIIWEFKFVLIIIWTQIHYYLHIWSCDPKMTLLVCMLILTEHQQSNPALGRLFETLQLEHS